MDSINIEHADLIRLGCFIAIFILLALLETAFPKRKHSLNKISRWPVNLGIIFLDTIIVKLLIPITTLGVAFFAENASIGLFNVLQIAALVEIILSILLLDLIIYTQHIVFHKIPVLWRFHRMHHSDLEIDTTTGVRFHPVEIIISLFIKLIAIITLGISPFAIVAFEIILNSTAIITHSNLKLPLKWDRIIRFVFVTPDMHRIHHSIFRKETDSNYGFNFSIWDRLFKTYIKQPKIEHESMKIGLSAFREPKQQRIDKLLIQPFKK